MGNLDRLLDALAARLPPTADRAALVAALKAATEALPASQKKTRARLERDDCVEVLEAKLKAAGVDKDDDEEGSDEPEGYAAYAGVDGGDPAAVIDCCTALLADALSSLRPAEYAAEALEGFLAMMGAEDIGPLNAASLRRCTLLVPAVAGALGGDEPPAWRHFLGFLLAAHARLPEPDGGGVTENDRECGSRLGSLAAMLTQPASARSAVRVALTTAGPAPKAAALHRLAPAVLPVLHSSFSFGSGLESPNRGDLVSLFYGLCFVSCCSAAGVGDACVLREARTTLLTALERHFDAVLLLPELCRIAAPLCGPRSDGLKRRLAAGASGSKAAVAGLAKEVLEAAVASLSASALERLAACSGLPMPEEESRVDRKAAAAKARGELFFEDAAGAEQVDSVKAIFGVGSLALERLEGVEALEGEGSESEADEPGGKSAALKKKKRLKGKRLDLHAVKKSQARTGASSGPSGAPLPAAGRPKRRRTKGGE